MSPSGEESWREWRRESEGLVWRAALPADLSAIKRVWKAKARILGVKCTMPDLFAWPVILTLVAEDQRGRIVDGVFLEASVDVTKLGANPNGFASLGGLADELAHFVSTRKIRRITAAMPESVSEKMAGGLIKAGFRRLALALWDRWT